MKSAIDSPSIDDIADLARAASVAADWELEAETERSKSAVYSRLTSNNSVSQRTMRRSWTSAFSFSGEK